ncbi:MAG: polysaccharide pyruvyl transferase family protein [Candidatus Methylumidiphilus sp.]
MQRFYLAGQNNFGNRGCEALVRSTATLLEQCFGTVEILAPSVNQGLDGRQWPEAASHGVKFIPTFKTPFQLLWWNRFASRIPWVKANVKPNYQLDQSLKSDVESCNAMLMIGGDVISLEYGIGSLFMWSVLADRAAEMKIPTILWAASVGPFKSDPVVEQYMVEHLRRYSAITVRESETLAYLKGLGIENVTLVTDPAFVMKPEPFDVSGILPSNQGSGILGFNVSPLVAKFLKTPEEKKGFEEGIVRFIQDVLDKTSLSVLLVPHVDPLDGSPENSDSAYMAKLLAKLGGPQDRLKLAPPTLNATQIKYLIGQCRYFMGARTHATIGALSNGVPTISIAYSVKAKGLNKDLFDHIRYVLETPKVSRQTLWESLEALQADEAEIKALLAERIPLWRERAKGSAEVLQKLLAGNGGK